MLNTLTAIDEEIKCNYIKCIAGEGLAGNGSCFLCGNPKDEDCMIFIDSEYYQNKWRNEIEE